LQNANNNETLYRILYRIITFKIHFLYIIIKNSNRKYINFLLKLKSIRNHRKDLNVMTYNRFHFMNFRSYSVQFRSPVICVPTTGTNDFCVKSFGNSTYYYTIIISHWTIESRPDRILHLYHTVNVGDDSHGSSNCRKCIVVTGK